MAVSWRPPLRQSYFLHHIVLREFLPQISSLRVKGTEKIIVRFIQGWDSAKWAQRRQGQGI